jgi:hypothetical protein
MASLFTPPYFDVGAGITPADGALLNFYVVGSGTRKDTFTTAAATVAHANPVVADTLGVFPAIYIQTENDWVLSDKDGVQKNTGSVSEFATIANSVFIKNFATLAAAVADINLNDGDALNIEERTGGNGGGAMWDVVLSSTVTENAINIVQGVGVGTLSLVLRVQNGHYIAEQWGIVGDDSTNNSVAQQAIADAAGTDGLVTYGKGTFRGNFTTSASIKGLGPRESILKTATTATTVVTLTGNALLWNFRYIKDIEIDGALVTTLRDSDGIAFADTAAGDEFNGRWIFDNIWFKDCDHALAKTTGNIGNTIRNCGFHQNNYGYWAKDVDAALIMQGSNDDFYKCEFHSSYFAAVYINSDTALSGQTTFNDCIFEDQQGTGGMTIFVKAYKTSYVPLTFNQCWFENNAQSGSVTIDSIAYTPQDLWVRECPMVILNKCNVESITADSNGVIVLDKCFLNENAEVTKVDQTSSVIALDCYTGGVKVPGLYVENITGFTRDSGGAADVLMTKPRSIIASATNNNYSLISSQDFSNEEAYSWAGTASIIGRSTPDGILFNSCCEIAVPTAHTQFGTATDGTATAGNYVVWTLDIKPTTANICTVDITGSAATPVTLATGLNAFLTLNEWTSLSGLSQVTAGLSDKIGIKIINTTGAGSTFRFSAWQCVQFTDIQDALTFYRSGIYVTNRQRRVFYGEAAPTTGTWVVGDRLYNTAPAAAGTMGWVCTTAGTPGTWKTFGAITA